MLILWIALALVAYYLYKFYIVDRQKYPPGPIALPFIGNMLNMDIQKIGDNCNEIAKKHGGVATIYLPDPTIIISDYETIRDVTLNHGDALSNRPIIPLVEMFCKGIYGLVFVSGDLWRSQRRFTLHVLRDFGVGKNVMESKIQYEVDRLTEHIDSKLNSEGQCDEVQINPATKACVASVIGNIVFGDHYKIENDPYLTTLDLMFQETLVVFNSVPAQLLNMIPSLKYVPLFHHFGADKIDELEVKMREMFVPRINKKKQFLNENSTAEPVDYCAAYLQEMKRRQDAGEPSDGFDDWQLYMAIIDLWSAGMETTGTTLEWGFLFMCENPDIQDKVKAELLEVCGDRRPTMMDKSSLPYTSAVITEIQRLANVLPLNVQASTTRDMVIGGYNIPKGTTVIPQTSAVHFDERHFENPRKFNPQRFIDNPKLVEKVNPFGLGKRSCMGESLARYELFLIFTALIQRYEFKLSPKSINVTSNESRMASFTNHPMEFMCMMKKRSV